MIKASTAVIETSSGKIEGVFRKGLYIFHGIPYAAPPVGERRWLPPATADIK
jgi:para-nitrobenzyl esterase